MKPPVESIKISSRARDILITTKRKTGTEHWNEVCRVALCRSLANPSLPSKLEKNWDTAFEIEWKTFAGELSGEFTTLILLSAQKHGVDSTDRTALAEYFRSHLERGISNLQSISGLENYVPC